MNLEKQLDNKFKQIEKLDKKMNVLFNQVSKINLKMMASGKSWLKSLAIVLIFCSLSYADELKIPFECYPQKVQEVFLKHGVVIDLENEPRSKLSFGFIKNEGNKFIIYTYKPVTTKDLDLFQNIITEYSTELKNG